MALLQSLMIRLYLQLQLMYCKHYTHDTHDYLVLTCLQRSITSQHNVSHESWHQTFDPLCTVQTVVATNTG
jgi:hypothetical protein